jgi:hypothetical protein
MARGLLLAVLLVVVTACSTVRLAYNQAPQLAFWWLDGFADFSSAQAPQVRQDIEEFMAWHRRQELPGYVALLEQWQGLVTQDITPALACRQYDTLRSALVRAGEHSLEPLTRTALGLSPEQLLHIQKSQAKSVERFEKEYLRGSAEKRLETRLDTAVERLETLYGRLNTRQREDLERDLLRSPFEARTTLQERQRNMIAVRQSIAAMQAVRPSGSGQPVPPAALDISRQYMSRLLVSPTPGYKDYQDRLVRHNCELFARLHNSTTPQQRAHALGVLKDYEADLRGLLDQR